MNVKALMVACLTPMLLASAAAGADGCRYGGVAYAHGAAVCQAGTQYRCDDGQWTSLAVACAGDGVAPSCEYNGTSYSSGATSCQSGTQYRCSGGAWTSLAVACGSGAPASGDLAGQGPPHTCMLGGTTVASASTVCKEGVTYLCNDGDWRNLGTPCR